MSVSRGFSMSAVRDTHSSKPFTDNASKRGVRRTNTSES